MVFAAAHGARLAIPERLSQTHDLGPQALETGDQLGERLDIVGGLLGLGGERLGLRFERPRVLEGLPLLGKVSRALLHRLCVESDGLAGLGVVCGSVGDTLHLREVGLAASRSASLACSPRAAPLYCRAAPRQRRSRWWLEVPSAESLLSQRPMAEHIIDGCGVLA